MPSFDEISDYLRALRADPSLAVIPFQMAADGWGVSRAAIDGMVRSSKLDEVRIAGTRYVRATSLQKLFDEKDEQVAKVREFVEEHARRREVVFYAPVMERVGLNWRVPADRRRIGALLGAVSEQTYGEFGVLLTAIVHRDTSGQTGPGPGFFGLAKSLELEWDDDDVFVATEMEKTWKHYAVADRKKRSVR
jgi:hypothetical protein